MTFQLKYIKNISLYAGIMLNAFSDLHIVPKIVLA